ncbi:MAG TPA: rhomboid family intramembrane serine protease [Oscillatoriaceae cyanobacterium M33_DOE_052]|uniref:Rhomboid family intramembrane serine protease n=1 Tax=Planktothricoides sp. SpSt-374 TaxID=2282167 RepID=A0A7C3ZW15_9CYAN|nr:rhomboid family intramembrane serine protease [Oscillatoriaceae cyanobacterium M33_DOE_052]
MIPISDNIPSGRLPLVNYAIMGMNVAIFLAELRLEITGNLGNFLQTWGIVPARIHSVITDAITTGNPAAAVAAIVFGTGPLVVAMFLHGSFSQILGNTLFLWVFGKQVEMILGRWRYLLFYLVCGILTGVAQVLVDPTLAVPLVGAQGAVAGVLGAYLLNFPKAKIESILPLVVAFIPVEMPAFFYLLWWFVQQIFYGIGQLEIGGAINPFSMAYWTQVLGMIVGAGLVTLLVQHKPNTAIY